jgi:hypothetical protein
MSTARILTKLGPCAKTGAQRRPAGNEGPSVSTRHRNGQRRGCRRCGGATRPVHERRQGMCPDLRYGIAPTRPCPATCRRVSRTAIAIAGRRRVPSTRRHAPTRRLTRAVVDQPGLRSGTRPPARGAEVAATRAETASVIHDRASSLRGPVIATHPSSSPTQSWMPRRAKVRAAIARESAGAPAAHGDDLKVGPQAPSSSRAASSPARAR